MKVQKIFIQVIMVALLGMAAYLRSPLTCLTVMAIALGLIAEDFFRAQLKAKEFIALEAQMAELSNKVSQLQKEINRMVVRQSEF